MFAAQVTTAKAMLSNNGWDMGTLKTTLSETWFSGPSGKAQVSATNNLAEILVLVKSRRSSRTLHAA